MKNKLIKTMMAVLLIQVLLFGVVVFGGKTLGLLTDEYLKVLENRVHVRKNDVQDEMLQRWSNITEFQEYVATSFHEAGAEEDLALVPALLEDMAEQIIYYLRQSGATEVFVVLEGENNHEGIHLRDLDPYFNSNDNSDILMERGSMHIAQKIGVPLDSKWSYKFDLTPGETTSAFYYKPYEAVKSYPNTDVQDLGYWSKPFRLSPDDIEIITYSLPLISDEGEPYGVIGIGLTTDYLAKQLKYDELADHKRGFYTLNVYDKATDTNQTVVTSGPLYNIFADANGTSYKKVADNIYQISDNGKIEGDIYASTQDIVLYNENTPFEQEKWSLVGFVEKEYLLSPIRDIGISLLRSLVLSLGIGVIAVYIAGNLFMKPINKLMQSVTKSSPNNPFKLQPTQISEIDELGQAIETLNTEVLDSASKLSQILNMVNIPIGAFEYTEEETEAFCTNTFFTVLGIENDQAINYIAKSDLIEILTEIKSNPETEHSNVYHYRTTNGHNCWIELTIHEQEGKVLGVIEDVTEDIVYKRKIEYERDHDILTYLLNRRAFATIVKKKMSEGISGHSAFIMWDLDNLKYVNDTYGHEYGDRYIQRTADVLKGFFVYNTVIARMSGDEFYIFLYGYESKEEIREIINEMKESLYHAFLEVPDGDKIRLRASGGVAWYPDDSMDYEELIKYTDFAMYEIKNKEKGNIGEFDINTYKKDSILLDGKEELNFFIDNAMVKYAFQPIIRVATGDIFAYESLMRPQTKRLQSPYDVIRLAQSQSKLYEIEKLTFFETMKAYKAFKDDFNGRKIFINSIANNALSEEDFLLFEEQFGPYLNKVVIEITENEQSDAACTRLKQAKVDKWQTHLALDDFGSGYNSELSLLILSPRYVKVDMTIVRGIDQDLNRQKLLQNILSYCKNKDIEIIAEGVETKAEMATLIHLGVDYMQGYYLGKPNLVPQTLDPQIKKDIQALYNE